MPSHSESLYKEEKVESDMSIHIEGIYGKTLSTPGLIRTRDTKKEEGNESWTAEWSEKPI